MFSMFHTSFLFKHLTPDEFYQLLSFVWTGTRHRLPPVFMDAEPSMEELQCYLNTFHIENLETPNCESDVLSGSEEFEIEEFDFLIDPQKPEPPKPKTPNNKFKELSHKLLKPSPRKRASPYRIPWTKEEDRLILRFYESHGPRWREMALVLAEVVHTDRSDDALRNRHARLVGTQSGPRDRDEARTSSEEREPRTETRRKWSPAEDRFVREHVLQHVQHASWAILATQLPHRTPHAIRNRANRLAMSNERAELVAA